jgi:hypothetical protein
MANRIRTQFITKLIFLIFLMLLGVILSINAQAQEYDSITITYRDLSFQKRNKTTFRLHVGNSDDGQIQLTSIDSYKLPHFFKKVKVTGVERALRFSFTKKDAFQYAMAQLDSQVAELYADKVFFRF